jgi:two-component system phosphate regulon response regulator PhoB
MLAGGPVDLVVLDWSLPGMSGVDLCRKLRKEARFGALPILFLTAHSTSDELITAFDAGADDFVSKPFRAPELKARVLGLLRRAQMPSAPS